MQSIGYRHFLDRVSATTTDLLPARKKDATPYPREPKADPPIVAACYRRIATDGTDIGRVPLALRLSCGESP